MRHALSISAAVGAIVSLCAAAPALASEGRAEVEEAPDARDQALSFEEELALLWSVVACGGERPEKVDDGIAAVADAHCEALAEVFEPYHTEWLKAARPFFDRLVPDGLPETVVYPFGGADLLTTLVVYPQLRELTSVSLEAAGDPRQIATLEADELERSLELNRQFLDKLVRVNHSRTLDLSRLKGDPLPSQVVFALVGLDVLGYEPVALRYFHLGEGGEIRYLTAEAVAEGEAAIGDRHGTALHRARANLFANVELAFRKAGAPDAPTQIYRHIRANLDDPHLEEDDRIIDHLRAKGDVAAITKAASYLLWWGNFDQIRRYLNDHAVWMVSDSTGIPPNLLDAERFELTTYGRFRATAIKGSRAGERSLREAYEAQPHRELPFMFGYPSKAQHRHLMVIRRK